ncbi:MAG: ATP-binding cassette domain-containing protein, partial [Thiohalocapsa sp.]|nr:ATP-binding cassette domain-containing protein [Thiohalocapsa sp.]
MVDAVNKADSGDEAAVLIDEVFQHVGVHCALSGVSLRVARGEGLLIIGPNGAGKTLLTRLIVGLDPPSAGHVTVFGRDLAQLGNRAMRLLRRRMGAVLQRGSLLDGLSVLENVFLPLRDTPMSKNDMARAARLAMTQLQL